MISQIGSSSSSCFCVENVKNSKITPLIFGIIACLGLVIFAFGLCSYLPPYCTWVGLAISALSIILIASQFCCHKPKTIKTESLYPISPSLENGDISSMNVSNVNNPIWTDKNGDTHLCRAARLGNIEEVRRLVTFHKELLHAQNEKGETPLHLSRNEEVTRLLVEHGASLTIEDKIGLTPLESMLYYTSSHQKESCLFLFKNLTFKEKVQILQRDYQRFSHRSIRPKFSQLHVFRDTFKRNMADLLNNEDIKQVDENGRTLLLNVYLQGDFVFANLLVEKGADCRVSDNNGQNLLHLTAKSSQMKPTPLSWVTSSENGAIDGQTNKRLLFLKTCCQKGLNINQRDNAGDTALDLFVKNRDINLMNSLTMGDLAELGVDFYSKDANGRCALHHACEKANSNMVYCLVQPMLKQGRPINFDFLDNDGNSPFHLFFTTDLQNLNFVAQSLKNLDPSILSLQNARGQTALHLLVEKKRNTEEFFDFFQILQRAGVDWKKCNKQDQNVFEYRIESEWSFRSVIIDRFIIFVKADDYEFLLKRLIDKKNFQVAFEVLNSALNLSKSLIKSFFSSVPLAYAFEKGDLPIIILLIHFIMETNDDRILPFDENLILSAKKGGVYEKLLKISHSHNGERLFQSLFDTILLENEEGFDVYFEANLLQLDLCNKEGRMAAHLACAVCNPKMLAKCLRFQKADAQGSKSETPLHLIGSHKMVEKNIEEVVRLLMEKKAYLRKIMNVIDRMWVTPLEWHVFLGNTAVVKALLPYRPSLSNQSLNNNSSTIYKHASPFHIAILNGRLEMVILLQEAGAVVNECWYQKSPLHIAAMYGHEEILLHLIASKKANLSLVDEDGKFYWHYFKDLQTLRAFVQKLGERGLADAQSQIIESQFEQDYLAILPGELKRTIANFLSKTEEMQFVIPVNVKIQESLPRENSLDTLSHCFRGENQIGNIFDLVRSTYSCMLQQKKAVNRLGIFISQAKKLNINVKFSDYIHLGKQKTFFANLKSLRDMMDYNLSEISNALASLHTSQSKQEIKEDAILTVDVLEKSESSLLAFNQQISKILDEMDRKAHISLETLDEKELSEVALLIGQREKGVLQCIEVLRRFVNSNDYRFRKSI